MNLLIPYVLLYNHPDPLLSEYTYGDVGARARKLKKDVRKGDYIFFHTSLRGRKCITAYYVVDRVMNTVVAAEDRNIAAKYRNPHILDHLACRQREADNVVLFGDPIESRVLEKPLPFNRSLAEQLSLGIRFPEGRSESLVIGSATRSWRQLTDGDVEMLLKAIKDSEQEGISAEVILSTDEVTEIIEKDLESFIESNPSLVGESVCVKNRQLDTPVGRIDLLLENDAGNLVVVELKIGDIGRDAVSQLRRYMDWLETQVAGSVSGMIVCKGVMPAFEDDLRKMKDVTILCYGWQLKVYPWSED